MKIKEISILIGLGLSVSCQNSSIENKGSTKSIEADKVEKLALTQVAAAVETEPVQAVDGDDAADDPAIWYNRFDPAESFILGSNKKLGIEVYRLDGQRVATYPTGRVNNIDVRYNIDMDGKRIDIVAGSNRTFNRIDVWQIDTNAQNFTLISDTTYRSELDEVYGFCLFQNPEDRNTYAFVNSKSGAVEQYLLSPANGKVSFEKVRTLKLNGQVEGMVADDEYAQVYIAEEEGGIYKFSALPEGSAEGAFIANSDTSNPNLAYDIEGLAIYYMSDGEGYLVASVQGNNTFAVFDRQAPNKYLTSFDVTDRVVDGVSETDGIDLINVSLRGGKHMTSGLFVCQDGQNMDSTQTAGQNFKLVPWMQIAMFSEPKLRVNSKYYPSYLKRDTMAIRK